MYPGLRCAAISCPHMIFPLGKIVVGSNRAAVRPYSWSNVSSMGSSSSLENRLHSAMPIICGHTQSILSSKGRCKIHLQASALLEFQLCNKN